MTDVSLLPDVIRTVRDEYAARGIDAYLIGNGWCEEFAFDVLTRWAGQDWHLLEGLQDVETANFVVREGMDSMDWDWALLAEHWGIVPPESVAPEKVLMVAQEEPSHIWITVGRRHYDVESPEGVDSFFDLMFFRRWLDLAPKGIALQDA